MYIQTLMLTGRRLFVGDLHGCRGELQSLLEKFGFRPGLDSLFSVGDVVGKGPDVKGTLQLLRDLDASVVAGNHDLSLLRAARSAPETLAPKQAAYLAALGGDLPIWVAWMETWPYYRDLGDILLVHAGLEPGKSDPAEMDPRVLSEVRTWDGLGRDLNRDGDPPWFECIHPTKTVVFGHWAKRGLVDLPGFKGLDTGCVYGGRLTGWSPEEDAFFQVPAERAYASIKG
jgi:bis(5'-nucleosyl)-tetraphosphatase (symmetrical)